MTDLISEPADTDEVYHSGLRGYVADVAALLGVGLESAAIDPGRPESSVYLALDGRLDNFPDRDVALLWDDQRGWSLAIETHSGEDLIVLAYLGGELLPPPGRVARFARALLAGGHSLGQPVPPRLPCQGRGELARALARYVSSPW